MNSEMQIDQPHGNTIDINKVKAYLQETFGNQSMINNHVYFDRNYEGCYLKSYRNIHQFTRGAIHELEIYDLLSRVTLQDFIFTKLKKGDISDDITFLLFNQVQSTFKDVIDYWRELRFNPDINYIFKTINQFSYTIQEMHRMGIANMAINPFNIGMVDSQFMFYETCSSMYKYSEYFLNDEYQSLKELYVSKELSIINNCESIDPGKCDVYSLGIIFYNLMSLNFPLTIRELNKKLDEEAPINHALRIFQNLIKKMINLDPKERPLIQIVIQEIKQIREAYEIKIKLPSA